MHEDDVGRLVIDCAVKLHQELGPGLLESVYETIMADKLRQSGLSVARQVAIAVEYHGHSFNEGFRADLIVGQKVIVELKSVDVIHPAHKKQVLTYLRLSKLKLGYLINFGEALMKDGITRVVNGQL